MHEGLIMPFNCEVHARTLQWKFVCPLPEYRRMKKKINKERHGEVVPLDRMFQCGWQCIIILYRNIY